MPAEGGYVGSKDAFGDRITACRHPDEPHAVWYWLDDPHDPAPAPYMLRFDNCADAARFVRSITTEPGPLLAWVKAFHAHNEAYTCMRWEASDG